MDPKTIRAAKAIPNQLKELVGALFDESKGALKQGVGTLRKSLGRIESYLEQVEKEHLEEDSTNETSKTVGRPRRPTGGKFPIAEFVLEQLRKNPKGSRPRDIAAALKEEAPGAHKDPSGVVSNTLSRLKGQKRVVGRAGKWKLASAVGSVGAASKKKTAKRKGPKKKAKGSARKKIAKKTAAG